MDMGAIADPALPSSRAAAAVAAVDTVTVRGAGRPVKLARIMRGGSAFVVRSQWVQTSGSSERQLRDAAAAEEQGAGEVAVACEATLSELAALKAVGATPTRTARAALVQAEWAHSMTRGATTSGAADIDLVLARLLFDGVTPLPATLPTPDREEEDSDSEGEEEAAAGAQPRHCGTSPASWLCRRPVTHAPTRSQAPIGMAWAQQICKLEHWGDTSYCLRRG
jgi:hypothetical protein